VVKALKKVSFLFFLLFVVFFGLHVFNYFYMGNRTFSKSAAEILNRSRYISQQASPYYQEKALATRAHNPDNGKFFRLDDMVKIAKVLEKPTILPSGDATGSLLNLAFRDQHSPVLRSALRKSAVQVNDGIAVIEYDPGDYLAIDLPRDIPVMQLAEIAIRVRANKGARMTLAWLYDSDFVPDSLLWENQISLDVVSDGKFHTYLMDVKEIVRRRLKINSIVKRLVMKLSVTASIRLEMESIRFMSTHAKYLREINGASYEVVGGEMRRCMYMIPPQSLQYSLQIPEKKVTLEFGTSILMKKEPVTFEIFIEADGGERNLYSKTIANTDIWSDTTLDLSPWSGKHVRLVLKVKGASSNVAFWSNPFLTAEPKQPFNVILILEDALRADHLSYAGYGVPTSPNKDRLLNQCGIVFDNVVSQSCKTRSSVPSIMTSLLPTVTGVWHSYEQLQDEYLTLAEIMRSQGFHTAAFIQNSNAGPAAGIHQGFCQLLDGETLGHATEGILGDRLKQWLSHNSQHNFFLYLHIVDPHGPYDPPPPFDSWYRNAAAEGESLQRTYLDPETVQKPTSEGRRLLYDGEIAHNDSLLPKLLENLKNLGIYDNTLLVFLSDHGEHLGEHGMWDHKEPGYIQTLHVPLAFVFPARFHTSCRILQTVQLLDVLPTILEFAHVDRQGLLLQGDSLIDLIEGRRLSYWNNRIVISEEPDEMSVSEKVPRLCGSVFFQRWHLISSRALFPGSSLLPQALRLEVFDRMKDSSENSPLWSLLPDLYWKYKFADTLLSLQSTDIVTWEKLTGNKQDQTRKVDPATQRNLKALGYVQ
jgi:arylsulfatase A-like enzyme